MALCAKICPHKEGIAMLSKLLSKNLAEIFFVISLVLFSIPIWQNFESKLSKAKISTLDDYHLTFNMLKAYYSSEINVDNPYNINKNYQIKLRIDEKYDLQNSNITINGTTYTWDSFSKTSIPHYDIYTLVDDYISASDKAYYIKLISPEKNIKYTYIFTEKNNF